MIAEDSLFSLTRLHEYLTTYRWPERWRRGRAQEIMPMNCLPALRGHMCGMLKGFNTPATNSRGNTSIAEVLVFPPEVSGNGTTFFTSEQLYFTPTPTQAYRI
jgi:hypothetical protein